ncbi:probable selenium-dependent hydroxylase accessory protein YqeC [Desulfonatronum thiosulfatophilum]|uniref:Probable selenium-dependent hydroxylase accessory protein YqeC n=1 Tax=Desulfonatronum thiosulfatophilum TaxID=617002 RepID=A0A1G6AM60_9BACT|nr:selenium cofactor biosynthesis protein YqeC [Desulfonatronum thiosulfatophilum]SDB09452.1 probable selenium-dependent hydroxylase accessory protein YqeC [Desulfonatronum thiosulfatophilum]
MIPAAPAELYLPDSRLVALIGAGGKTSLMAAMAAHAVAAGESVISTTTTKIHPPAPDPRGVLPGDIVFWDGTGTTLPDILELLSRKKHLTLVRDQDPGTGKLLGLAPEAVDLLAASGMADRIFVEADGARGRALKAPAEHEPVIPAKSDLVIGIIGADAIGAPVDEEHVFRSERLAVLCGSRQAQMVNARILACLAVHRLGLFKNAPSQLIQTRRIIFVNKMDLVNAKARQILLQARKQAKSQSKDVIPSQLWLAGSIKEKWILPVDECVFREYEESL